MVASGEGGGFFDLAFFFLVEDDCVEKSIGILSSCPSDKLIDSEMSTSSAIRASSSTALFMTRVVGGGEDPVGRQSKVSVEGSGQVEANGSAAATGGGGAGAGEGVPLAGKAWYS